MHPLDNLMEAIDSLPTDANRGLQISGELRAGKVDICDTQITLGTLAVWENPVVSVSTARPLVPGPLKMGLLGKMRSSSHTLLDPANPRTSAYVGASWGPGLLGVEFLHWD